VRSHATVSSAKQQKSTTAWTRPSRAAEPKARLGRSTVGIVIRSGFLFKQWLGSPFPPASDASNGGAAEPDSSATVTALCLQRRTNTTIRKSIEVTVERAMPAATVRFRNWSSRSWICSAFS
jgi:hypothetical protein